MTPTPSSLPSAGRKPAAPRWVATALLLWLSLLVLGTGFASAVLLSSAEDYADSTSFQMVLCMTGGALGASLTALLAAGERIARGWSFAADALARGERGFNARLAPLLAVQPILGAALGLALLLLLSAGAVMLLRVTEGTTFDPMGLLLFALIAGLFARTLLARVRDSFEALFGRRPGLAPNEARLAAHDADRAGQARGAAAPAVSAVAAEAVPPAAVASAIASVAPDAPPPASPASTPAPQPGH